jgi:hypothetical protein
MYALTAIMQIPAFEPQVLHLQGLQRPLMESGSEPDRFTSSVGESTHVLSKPVMFLEEFDVSSNSNMIPVSVQTCDL